MIGSLVFPVVLYLLLSMSITGLLQMIIPAFSNASAAMWLLTLANALQIPVFGLMYRRDRGEKLLWKKKWNTRLFLLVVLTSFFFSRGVNGFLGLTPLPRLFPGYEAAAGEIYSCSLVSQVMASVITAPILEELLMRGILYRRLRRFLPDKRYAFIAGAFLFALFHGNVVQGIYAFFTGLFFIWVYEVSDSLVPAVAAHMTANASSIFLERTGIFDGLYDSLPIYFLTTAVCLLLSAFFWKKIRMKSWKKR